MTSIKKAFTLVIAILLFAGYTSMAQKITNTNNENSTKMKTYLIEREIPEAGKFTAE